MKKYILNKIIYTIELFIIFIFVFLINKESYSESIITSSINNNLAKALDLETITNSQNELYNDQLNNEIYSFTGELTGYAADCPLCTGYLACPPRTNVLKKGIYYTDSKYGKIRIVASSKKYPCGTILKFKSNKLSDEPIIAIVLDRGVGGNTIDLLSESEDVARKEIGRITNLNFDVLREGWK